MDFPKSVPNVGLVGGLFVDENVSTGQPGSLIPSAWGNSVTLEMLSVLSAAGVVPDEFKTNQLAEAISNLVTSGANWSKITGKPTTLAGYGITDAYTKTEAGTSFASKATTLAGYGITDAYTATQSDNRYAGKATTLAGYGITDAYTKTEAGTSFASKATTLAGYNIGDAYTQNQVNALLSNKANNVQASETVAGIAAVSTPSQTNSGIDDQTIVTPKKLCLGFSAILNSTAGYVRFPSWMSGLLIQWGRVANSGSGTSLTFPAGFIEVYGIHTTEDAATTTSVETLQPSQLTTTGFIASGSNFSTSGWVPANIPGWYIAYGK